MDTNTRFNGRIPSGTLFWRTMAEPTLTLMMYVVSLPFCLFLVNLTLLTGLQGCNRRLDPLLAYPAWVRRTVPTGISNDAMGSVPQHPFFLRVIELLQSYDRSWLLPYITVMYSTGPLFLSVLWKEYMLDKPSEASRVRILMQDEYNRYSWSFFTHHVGNSWHGKDAQLIFWVGSK